jgi:hypothetical protein
LVGSTGSGRGELSGGGLPVMETKANSIESLDGRKQTIGKREGSHRDCILLAQERSPKANYLRQRRDAMNYEHMSCIVPD